ncbi:hypothetical protein EU528_14645 [Candidatus Thorarchaeota archaeon]|nr:MAG: hypothetical protein EU528_14645 [Candidatus Thorarchaeota archaeon]
MKESNPRIRLYEKQGETSIYIDAEIDKEGNLIVSGQDLGKAPEEFWGDSDYEYMVFVKKDQRDMLLLSLIKEKFGGNAKAFSNFRDFLEKYNIKYEFDSWV